MKRKKKTRKLTNADTLRNLKFKAIQLNAVDPSKAYVVELNDLKEGFGERAMMVTEIFKKQEIPVIVVPPKTIKIYRSERNTLKKLLDKEV